MISVIYYNPDCGTTRNTVLSLLPHPAAEFTKEDGEIEYFGGAAS